MRPVKSRVGTLRADRAAATRKRILDAARQRFAKAGYATTTLRDIADAAGVAVQTVYAIFGSKGAILRALRDSVVDHPGAADAYRAALASEEPELALRSFARSIRLRWDGNHDIVSAVGKAAAADPSISTELATALRARRRGIRQLAERVAALASMEADRVEAILDALTMPELYQQLVDVHNWAPDAYEVWLGNALVELVLTEPG
ncbi:MAG: helix-turn-helix domain-containing protein [Chloroflexota bacterium]